VQGDGLIMQIEGERHDLKRAKKHSNRGGIIPEIVGLQRVRGN